MKKDEFKSWLQAKYPDSNLTVRNRITNCNTVENNYGDLDEFYKKDRCNALIEEFNYSTDDEREQRTPNHRVPIEGNIRTGSATLKSAIKLYVEFRDIQDELVDLNPTSYHNETTYDSKHKIVYNDILNSLKKFNYNSSDHKDITLLQQDINDYLNKNMGNFTWSMEFKPTSTLKDSIDIFGISDVLDLKVVIELDAHRADQVAKKFLSRSALMINESIIYLSICYPGTENMPITECKKYFEYCRTLSKSLAEGSGKDKLYAGIFLE
jgi:hypothetical protein